MRRKAFVLFFTAVLLLALAAPAFAGWDEVTTFGFNDNHTRVTQNNQMPVLWPAWYANIGTSYSQPLILDGDFYGKSQPVVIAAGGNTLNGFVSVPAIKDMQFQPNPPLWSLPLKGDNPTKSHPTLVDLNGRKLVFIGSDHDSSVGGAWLQVFDLTDFDHPKEVFHDWSSLVHDIVSAPVVTHWNGHLVVLTTCGDTDRVALWVNMDGLEQNGTLNPGNETVCFLDLPGRTSSTPSIVTLPDGSKGFAVGVDQGLSSGELAIYSFNDILGENNGKVYLKNKNFYRTVSLPSGLVASFSTSQDGTKLYFGDCQSRVYCYDTANMKGVWENIDNAGIFSNRSPGLTDNTVYFPAVGGSSINNPGPGKLLSIDRSTGQTNWAAGFSSRAQTAPAIWLANGGAAVLEGTSAGYLAVINPNDGTEMQQPIAVAPSSGTSYGSGISGEISVAHDLLTVTTVNGIKAWDAIPIDLAAVSIDPGCPQVNGAYTAKPGQTYTATVTYQYQQDPGVPWPLDKIPVAAFHLIGDTAWKVNLTDSNGNPLPTNPDNNQQIVSLNKQGDTVTVKFTWTADTSAPTTYLVAGLNTNYPSSSPQLKQYYPELNLTNNLVKVPVNVYLPDNLSVQITNYPTQVYSGDPIPVTALVSNTSGKYVMTDFQWKVNGQVVKSYDDFDLVTSQGNTYTMTAPDVSQPTTITFEADVNPNHDKPADESNWDDNSATCTVTVLPHRQNPGGTLAMWIDAPSYVSDSPLPKPWTFTVWIQPPDIPPPPPPPGSNSPPPPPPKVDLMVTTSGGERGDNYNYSTGKQDIVPVDPSISSWTKTISVPYNDPSPIPVMLTYPWSGVWGQPTVVQIKANGVLTSWCIGQSAEADATVNIGPVPIPGKKQILTQ